MAASGFFSGNYQKKTGEDSRPFSCQTTADQHEMVCCTRRQYVVTGQLFFTTARSQNHSATSGEQTTAEQGASARDLAGDSFTSRLATYLIREHQFACRTHQPAAKSADG